MTIAWLSPLYAFWFPLPAKQFADASTTGFRICLLRVLHDGDLAGTGQASQGFGSQQRALQPTAQSSIVASGLRCAWPLSSQDVNMPVTLATGSQDMADTRSVGYLCIPGHLHDSMRVDIGVYLPQHAVTCITACPRRHWPLLTLADLPVLPCSSRMESRVTTAAARFGYCTMLQL